MYENIVVVVFCNVGGFSGLFMFIVGVVKWLFFGKECMEIVDLDLDVLWVVEGNYKVREDMVRSGWYYGYKMGGREM